MKVTQLGFEIKTESASILKPKSIQIWNQDSQFSDYLPQKPLKYFTDALIGLNFVNLIPENLKNSLQKELSELLCQDSQFEKICPYQSLYKNSALYLKEKNLNQNLISQEHIEKFENSWFKLFEKFDFSQEFEFKNFEELIDLIETFEEEIQSPLLYNFNLKWSDKFEKSLLSLYSFMYHMRALTALDHNSQLEDTSFESVHCDSITDYLPKSDFTVNDALVYWQFKKLSIPFKDPKAQDVRIEKLFLEPLDRAFEQYNHNATTLIHQLPQNFLVQHSIAKLESELHEVQMHWLLGSSAGLLFRVREELFGIYHGYHKVFWHHTAHQRAKPAIQFKICVDLESFAKAQKKHTQAA